MPLFDFKCNSCGKISEILIFQTDEVPVCSFCGDSKLDKLVAAHSSMSGPVKKNLPGLGDTACCGSSPGEHQGCQGPGSCCGKHF